MKGSTLMRNRSAALSVKRHSPDQVIWRLMKESILVRNHSAAPSVTTAAQTKAAWGPMKESTMMRNRTAALSAKRHLHRQVNWSAMRGSTPQQTKVIELLYAVYFAIKNWHSSRCSSAVAKKEREGNRKMLVSYIISKPFFPIFAGLSWIWKKFNTSEHFWPFWNSFTFSLFLKKYTFDG